MVSHCFPFTGRNGAKVRQRIQRKLNKANIVTAPLSKVSAEYRKTKSYNRLSRRLDAKFFIKGKTRYYKKKWLVDVEVLSKRGKRVRKFRVRHSRYTRAADRMGIRLIKWGILPEKDAPEPEPIAWDGEPEPIQKVEPTTELAPDPDPEPPPVATNNKPRLVVRTFKGKSASRVRLGAVRALQKKRVKLVPNGTFTQKAKAMGAKLSKDDGHVEPARALRVNGLVEGDVLREGNRWSAYVRLVDGASNKVIEQQFYEARTSAALARAVERGLWTGMGDSIAELAPTPETQKEAKKKKRKRRSRRLGLALPAALDLGLYARVVRRGFKYKDDLRGDLRSYTLNAAPGIALSVRWYPAAHFVSGIASQFGLDVEYERLFDFNSTREDGLEFPSKSRAFGVGLRWRYPLKRLQPSVMVGYGAHSFRLLPAGPPTQELDTLPYVPQVKYRYLRAGAELRADVIAGLKATVGVGYRHVLDGGEIHSRNWFPRGKAGGLDARLILGYALPAGFEIRVGIDYRRYFHNLNPEPPNPPWVAGGALDQYYGLTAGLAWRN